MTSLPDIVWPEVADSAAEVAASHAILETLDALQGASGVYLAVLDPPPPVASQAKMAIPYLAWGRRGCAFILPSRSQLVDGLEPLFALRTDSLILLAVPAEIPPNQWPALIERFMAKREPGAGVTGLVFDWGRLIEVVGAGYEPQASNNPAD